MTSKQVLRKTIVAVSAATMVALATPGVAGAAPVNPQDEKGQAGSTANNALTGMPTEAKLKVHKMTPSSKTEGLPKANGAAIDNPGTELPGSQPIKGVTFEAFKIQNVDLRKNEGWRTANSIVASWEKMTDAQKQSAEKITVGQPGSSIDYAITKAAAWTGETDENGLAESGNLPAGLYVVRESIKGDNVTIDGKSVPKGAVVKGSPFVVALPMTNPNDTTQWMKEVNVYPKNSKSGVTKKVEDADAHGTGNTGKNIGMSTVTYTISADIPAGYEKPLSQESNEETADKSVNRFRNFQLVDEFDSRVNYKGGDKVELVVEGTEDGKVTLTKGESNDYTIAWAPDNVTTLDGESANHVKRAVVTLTDKGLAKLAKFSKDHPGSANKVVWTLKAAYAWTDGTATGQTVTKTDGTATQVDEEKYDLTNQTWVIPDFPPNSGGGKNKPYKPTDEVPPNTPGAKVVSKFGKVILNKTDSKTGKELEGVQFQLWTCNKAGDKTSSSPVMVNNETLFKTAANGQLVISGLRLNNWKNDSSEGTGLIADPDEYYCLEEVKAKEGYEKLPNLIQFQLLTTDPEVTKTLDVKNVPANGGFDLPLTGGKGVFPLIALGGLLVAGSAGYAAYASRRKNARA